MEFEATVFARASAVHDPFVSLFFNQQAGGCCDFFESKVAVVARSSNSYEDGRGCPNRRVEFRKCRAR